MEFAAFFIYRHAYEPAISLLHTTVSSDSVGIINKKETINALTNSMDYGTIFLGLEYPVSMICNYNIM